MWCLPNHEPLEFPLRLLSRGRSALGTQATIHLRPNRCANRTPSEEQADIKYELQHLSGGNVLPWERTTTT